VTLLFNDDQKKLQKFLIIFVIISFNFPNYFLIIIAYSNHDKNSKKKRYCKSYKGWKT